MKTLRIFLLLLATSAAMAQEQPAEEVQTNPKAQQKIKAAHAAYITERLGLTPEEAEKFWPIYREYAQKRQDIRQQLKDARKQGQDDRNILELDLKVKQQELDLEKDFAGRAQKIISPQKLVNLRPAERDFRNLVLRQIQQRQQQQERREQLRDRSQQRHLQQRNN